MTWAGDLEPSLGLVVLVVGADNLNLTPDLVG